MNTRQVDDFETIPVSLRSAFDMSRACRPTCASPISPSSSARGTSAATESTTTTSTEPLRTSVSVISRACSPSSGWDTSSSSVFTPSARQYSGSRACSASTNAATPPSAWAEATTVSARVVFPEDSGPNTSTTRPRGKPPTPSAASTEITPVGMADTSIADEPRRMMAPRPCCFSICPRAMSRARERCSALLEFLAAGGMAGGSLLVGNGRPCPGAGGGGFEFSRG